MDKFNILMIDDKQENLYSLRLLLEDNFEDINILEALKVDEAILRIMTQDIDLILSDVQMPDMDGFDLINYLKTLENTKDIPIILVSAIHDKSEFIKRGYDLGVVDYITKPIDDEIFVSKLKVYIDLFTQKIIRKEELTKRDRVLLEEKKMNSMLEGLSENNKSLKDYSGFLYKEDSEIDLEKMLKVKEKIDMMMQ